MMLKCTGTSRLGSLAVPLFIQRWWFCSVSLQRIFSVQDVHVALNNNSMQGKCVRENAFGERIIKTSVA